MTSARTDRPAAIYDKRESGNRTPAPLGPLPSIPTSARTTRSSGLSGQSTLVSDTLPRADRVPPGKRKSRTHVSGKSLNTFYEHENGKTHWGAAASPSENDFVDHGDMPYTADELGEEMAPNARVWRVYMDEATQFDNDMIESWNHSLDVLLVFAGLFSGVVTTFAIQSSQNAQPNFAQVSVLLQQQMLDIMQGTPVESTSALSWTPSQTTGQTQWINALWFTSLACSLSSAFVSMLVKQWLQEYQSDMSGTPQDRARLRQYRYMGLNAWQVPAIVNVLPVLLHISLFFFFVGLVLFLWSLDQTSATPVLIIGAAAFLGYLSTTLLPIVFPQCPYVTPISIGFLKLLVEATLVCRVVATRISHVIQGVKSLSCRTTPCQRGSKQHLRRRIIVDDAPLFVPIFNPRKAAEMHFISSSSDVIDGRAIMWLLSLSTGRAVMECALCAIAGLPRGSAAVEVLTDGGAFPLVDRYFRSCFPPHQKREGCSLQQLSRAGCYARAWMHLASQNNTDYMRESEALVRQIFAQMAATTQAPDFSVIGSCALMQFYGSGYSTVRMGLELLKQSIEGGIQLKPYTLSLLLDTIAWTAIKWAVPSSQPHEVGAVSIFVRLIHSLQPDPCSDLTRVISLSFAPFVESMYGPYGQPLCTLTAGSASGSRELLVHELMRVTGDPVWYGLDANLLSLAIEEVTRFLSDGLDSIGTAKKPIMPSYIAESIAELASRFLSGRLCPATSANRILANVFRLFLQSPSDVPWEDARFISNVSLVLMTSQDCDIIRRAIMLSERCIAESSEPVLRVFVEHGGLSGLFQHITPVSANRGLAISLLRVFFVGVTLMYRGKVLNVERLLGAIFRSTAINVLCLGAEEDVWTLSETHSWLSSFLELCHFRPSDPVWRDVISAFSTSIRKLLEEDQDSIDELSAQIRQSLPLQIEALRRLACLEGGEFDYRRATTLVPFFASIDTETSRAYEVACMQSARPYGILASIV